MDINTLERLEIPVENVMPDLEELIRAIYSLPNVLNVHLVYDGDSWAAWSRTGVEPILWTQVHLNDVAGAGKAILRKLLLDCEAEASGLV